MAQVGRLMYFHGFQFVNIDTHPASFTEEDYDDDIFVKAIPSKVVGAVYSEVIGSDVVFSYAFLNPREDVVISSTQRTITVDGVERNILRKNFDVRGSRASLRNFVKSKFNKSDTITLPGLGLPAKGKQIQQAIMNHLVSVLAPTTRASLAVQDRLHATV